jgi:hypothetical protein
MKFLRVILLTGLLIGILPASYVVEWSASLSYSYAYVYSGNQHTSYDVTGDSVPDIFVTDSAALKVYSGVTHNLIWNISTSPYYYIGYPYVTNTDGDANKELVILVYRLNGSAYAGKFMVYDCQTHNQEYTSSEKSGYPYCSVADVDGDNKSEICLTSGGSGSRILEVYGSTDIGIDEEVKPQPIRSFGSAIPNPVKDNVRFNVILSETGAQPVLITDVTGRVVRNLTVSGNKNNSVQVIWDCLDDAGIRVPVGNYFYRCGNTVGKIEVIE